MDPTDVTLRPIGYVDSPLTDTATAPKDTDEDAPPAWLVVADEYVPALDGLSAGDDIVVVTWLHLARRDTLRVHPRGDTSRPRRGVFSTRSPSRPNPIGLHTTVVADVSGGRVRVEHMEAVDGTPILDLKPSR